MNLIDIFRRLGPEEKQVCLFWGKEKTGWKRRLAWNPIDQFTGAKEDLEAFTRKHAGKFIVGYLSYDLELCFFAYDSYLSEDSELTPELNRILERELPEEVADFDLQSKMTKPAYEQAFRKVKDYIQSGDIYQMNLTILFESEFKGNSKFLFSQVMKANPVDFMVYLEVNEDLKILSASPERFIHTQGEKIHTYPIKGTRPRGATPEEDEKERVKLINSAKEKAELNMITDLLRNDIGKVSKTGSVVVRESRKTRAFPSIWHTYSHIEGHLAVSPIQALLSMSPGGSITGCPKVRAMEVIDELETQKRGIYTGSIGFIDESGDIDFNIAIRTLLLKKDQLHLQVGGGLVYDSELDSEWEEIFNKARPFLGLK